MELHSLLHLQSETSPRLVDRQAAAQESRQPVLQSATTGLLLLLLLRQVTCCVERILAVMASVAFLESAASAGLVHA